MRWLFLIGGGLATAAMFVISMWLNFLFGYGLGQTPVRAVVFGCVSVIVDAWKGLGPIFILALARTRRLPSPNRRVASRAAPERSLGWSVLRDITVLRKRA
jgi:hypothetical protein